jgi:hypothetical protein
MRRGAAFEAWLVKQGTAPELAAEWVSHVVWASGWITGRCSRPLAVATSDQLGRLAVAASADWRRARPALWAWFDWVLPDGQSNPMDLVAPERPSRSHLRVVV